MSSVKKAKVLLKEVEYAKLNWDAPRDNPWFMLVLRLESMVQDLLKNVKEEK